MLTWVLFIVCKLPLIKFTFKKADNHEKNEFNLYELIWKEYRDPVLSEKKPTKQLCIG